MKKKETTTKEESDFVDRRHVKQIWIGITGVKRYFESLKVRDLIVGRIALLILLSVSTLTIAAPSWTGYETARIAIAFLTLFATVTLYWVGKNGYIFSVTGLLDIVINRNFGAFHDFDKTSREKMERIEEQRLLLDNYASDCPNFTLLRLFYYIRTKKDIDNNFCRLADSPRFREKLEINFWIFILAHFFACQRIADKKNRVVNIIQDKINEDIIKKIRIMHSIQNEVKK